MNGTQVRRCGLVFIFSLFLISAWSAENTQEKVSVKGNGLPPGQLAYASTIKEQTPVKKLDQESGNNDRHENEIRIEPFAYLDMRTLESMEVTATGYSPGKESTGKSPGHPEYGITYSGVKVRRADFSTIAADPNIFPLGTILYIPGYGFGVVADTGSAIKGHKIDLYFDTKQQVYEEWGKKNVKVFILRKGDGKVTETMMDRLNKLGKSKTVMVDKAM